MSTHAHGAQQTPSPLICGQWTMVIFFNFQSYRPLTPDQKKKNGECNMRAVSKHRTGRKEGLKEGKPTQIWAGVYFIKRFTT